MQTDHESKLYQHKFCCMSSFFRLIVLLVGLSFLFGYWLHGPLSMVSFSSVMLMSYFIWI